MILVRNRAQQQGAAKKKKKQNARLCMSIPISFAVAWHKAKQPLHLLTVRRQPDQLEGGVTDCPQPFKPSC